MAQQANTCNFTLPDIWNIYFYLNNWILTKYVLLNTMNVSESKVFVITVKGFWNYHLLC